MSLFEILALIVGVLIWASVCWVGTEIVTYREASRPTKVDMTWETVVVSNQLNTYMPVATVTGNAPSMVVQLALDRNGEYWGRVENPEAFRLDDLMTAIERAKVGHRIDLG